MDKNVFGETLKSCCTSPLTGYFRDACCRTDKLDHGNHTVCAIVTEEFLEFSRFNNPEFRTAVPWSKSW